MSTLSVQTIKDVQSFDFANTTFANAYNVANAAFGRANTALQNTSGTFAGNLSVTGNVGIGTTSPSFKLDISGALRCLSSSEGIQTTGDTIGRDLLAGKNDVATCIGYAGSDAMVQGTNFTLSSTPNLSLQPYGGQIKTPAQAYAEATSSSGYNLGNGSSPTLVVWNSITVNTGNCLNASNGRFTCPTTGVYFITATAIIRVDSTSSDYRIRVNRNDSGVTNVIQSKSSGYPSIIFSQMVYASAGDYFTIHLWNDAGTGATQPDASYTRFTCRFMG